MARRAHDATEFGSDSFLDIITNVVGILIILVISVGIRAKEGPVGDERPAEDGAALAGLHAAADSLKNKTSHILSAYQGVGSEISARQIEQAKLSDEVEALLQEIARHRAMLDSRGQTEAQIRRQDEEAKKELARLQEELAAAETARPQAALIECYPTPISRFVEGKEAHFQLREGRLAFIPLENLLNLLRPKARDQIWKLKDLPEATDTVGPVGGFRLRFTMERVDAEESLLEGHRGSYARLSQWTLIPSSAQLGEPIETALAQRSQFRSALARFQPQQSVVTIWIYPDSFAAFRQLKKELYHLGYAVAGRPLPEGYPIAGSPNGSKSSAQ